MSRPFGFHHTEETRQKMSQPRELNGNWKGGKWLGKDGYVRVLKPEHPYCDADGYVFEHRLVLEEKLSRYLLPSEVSHHLNGIKDDNRPENLGIDDNHSPHRKEHAIGRSRNEKGQFVEA